MTLTPDGAQLFWQLRHEAVSTVTDRFYATHGTGYQHWGARGREACQEDIGFHIEFLRPVLAFGLIEPMVGYLSWLQEVLEARGIPTEHLVQSLQWLGDFYADRLPPEDGVAVRHAIHAVLAAWVLAEPGKGVLVADTAWPEADLFEQALLMGQRQAAQQVVHNCQAQGHSLVDIEAHVVQPAMYRIGDGWQANRVTVVQEHMATAIAHAVMSESLAQQAPPALNGRRVILACVTGNHHALGLRMVADAFEVQGWEVMYLGANVPTRALVDMVVSECPDLLGLSVSFAQQLVEVRDVMAQLNACMHDARPPVIVGGLVINRFKPLVNMVGVDAHAGSALDVVREAGALLARRAGQ
jgi:methanogenic corrinoid protein MtbC1